MQFAWNPKTFGRIDSMRPFPSSSRTRSSEGAAEVFPQKFWDSCRRYPIAVGLASSLAWATIGIGQQPSQLPSQLPSTQLPNPQALRPVPLPVNRPVARTMEPANRAPAYGPPVQAPTLPALNLRVAQVTNESSGQLQPSGPQQSNSTKEPNSPKEPSGPPAFGPGSPSYGQPFFYQPGVTENPAAVNSANTPNLNAPANQPQQNNAVQPNIELPAPPLPNPPPVSSQAANPQALGSVNTLPPPNNPPQINTHSVPPAPMVIEPIENFQPGGPATWVFNFHDAPWPMVLKNFARHSQMSLQLEQYPQGSFTYYDDRTYSFTEALDVLNDHLLQHSHLLVRNENKLTLIAATNAFRDGIVPFVPLRAIPQLGRNELVTVAFPTQTGLNPQSVLEMQQLLTSVGRVQPLSNSGRLIVTDTGASLRRLRDLLNGSGLAANESERFVIRLRNTKAETVAASVNQRLGQAMANAAPMGIQQVGGTQSQQAAGYVAVVAEKETNSLLIEGSPEEIARIESLVREIDRDPPQVVIQALLVEVLLGNAKDVGVELGFQDSVLFDRSVIDNVVSVTQTTTAPNGVQTTNQNIISQTAAPGFNFNGAPLGNNVAVRPSTVGKQSVTNLGLGRVNGDLGFGGLVLSAGSNSVNVLLRALAENHKVDVLSRPQVRTVNNHEALIQIGQQVPVVDGVTLSPNGTANPVIRQDKAGIILRVTPRIADDGLVQIEVQAEKSAYQLAPGSGVPIFTDASNGNVIEAPVKDITTAQTTVAALSGQTIVLGGMITRDQTEVHRKVPLLGDIPLLGRLFRVDLEQTNRKELLIFLTPVIVHNASESDCQATQESSRITLAPDPNIDLHRDFMRAADQARLPTAEGMIEAEASQEAAPAVKSPPR